ncbi:MAG: AAA domain-containing protein [Terriglobales bacterium]
MSTPVQSRISTQPISIDPKRKQLVDKARENWTRRLIDLSRRNNLLYYRPLKTGTLDLAGADTEQIARLVAGETVSIRKLLPDYRDDQIAATVRNIARKALENSEEKGLQTLFVSFGMATWPATDEGRPSDAPVLLMPVTAEMKVGSGTCTLTRGGVIQANVVLLHVLTAEFGVHINSEDLLAHLEEPEDADSSLDPAPLYEELKRRAGEIHGFEVKPAIILGNFAFQKMAMVRDLESLPAELAAHDVVAAIAGDSTARSVVSATQQHIDPIGLDRIPPELEFAVVDADSSQQCAIAGIAAGQNAVVHGPPGTGKSQTIANLIATLAASGKRVLFVAEKRAALEVVLARLDSVGLAHLAIDLHGADLSPRRVMQHVAKTLDTVRSSTAVSCADEHRKLVERRSRLNQHVERLHSKRSPAAKSVYELQGLLLHLSTRIEASTRWRGDSLNKLTPVTADAVRDMLKEAAGFASLFLRTDRSPWTGAQLGSGASVRNALDLVAKLERSIREVAGSLDSTRRDSGLQLPISLARTKEALAVLDGLQKRLDIYSTDVFRQDLNALAIALAPAQFGLWRAAWAWTTSSEFRRSREALIGLRKAGKVPSSTLLAELLELSELASKWNKLSDRLPSVVPDWKKRRTTCDSFFQEVAALQSCFPHKAIADLSVDECAAFLRALYEDQRSPYQLPKLTEIECALETAGVGALVAELRERKLPVTELWPILFDHAWFASTLDSACDADIDIRGFRGETHNGYVKDFRELDRKRIALAAERVRHSHGVNAIAAMNANPSQEHLIRAEAAKSRRHIPLRKVFEQAAEVLTAVCPCWMASPLSVSQLLDGRKQYFDYVVFDEASQVLPEDAIPSILRASKVVVAGDNKQLPPTTFFASAEEDELAADEESSTDGFESLLDMMIPFVHQFYLDWHYRSRDEALINFSNMHLYDGRLVTFPGAGGPQAVSHVLAAQPTGTDGQEESSTEEIRTVVSLILDHARTKPDQTLGVITMGIKHMYRVQAALDQELQGRTELHEFFDPNRRERFFIKNLERVQGDERDTIIVSIGYGKDRAGNLPLRFGPLLNAGGRRRLNVAITRARQALTLVSSFGYTDIDLGRVRPGSGVEMLRDYLHYASTNGKRLGDAELSDVPPNAFEADVMDSLAARGLKLIPQVGASAFRIDIVAEHPRNPGRFVLAIECDGASYHSSCTARDRDRLRQQQLENLGWRFHRVWSTDWFLQKEQEVERTMKAFAAAVEFADRMDVSPPEPAPHLSAPTNIRGNGSGADSKLQPNNARTVRPPIARRESISDYALFELIQLVVWLNSDGQLRTDDQIVSEMVDDLGFTRRGVRIETALRSAIRSWRARQSF